MYRSMTRVALGFASILWMVSATACGDDDNGGEAGTGGAAGQAGSGGSSGAGGSAGTGGSEPVDPYACYAAQEEPSDPGGSATAGADCCAGLGTCVARADITDPTQNATLGHVECSATDDLVCAPKLIPSAGDAGVDADAGTSDAGVDMEIVTCTSQFGATELEGRCLPSCFLAGSPSASTLTEGSCPAGMGLLCAPCYSPIDASDTGACRQNGDAPVDEAPAAFATCGAYEDGEPAGVCVPAALAGGAGEGSIGQDTCDEGEVCAPTSKVADPNSCFAKCDSIEGDGACVPMYIIASSENGASVVGFLTQDTCADNERCAPCVFGGDSTGACEN